MKQAAWSAKRPLGQFAHWFGGLVSTAECQQPSVIAYLDRREEDEILIDPRDVNVINRFSVSEDDKTDEVDVAASEGEGRE